MLFPKLLKIFFAKVYGDTICLVDRVAILGARFAVQIELRQEQNLFPKLWKIFFVAR